MHRVGMRKIINRLIDRELFQLCLFSGEGFRSSFISAICSKPKRVTQRQYSVVHRQKTNSPFALPEIAVLFVIPNSDNYSQYPVTVSDIQVKSAERGFGNGFIQFGDAVFDVVRRGDLVELQA